MSEQSNFADPLLVILGALASALGAALIWLCKNKCRNQECEVDSGCCRFHSDSSLRATIRKVIENEKKRSESEVEDIEISEEIELTLPKHEVP